MALQRSAGTTNIKAWELTMTAIDLQDTYIRQNILEARAMVNQALALDPDYVFAWVALAWTHWQEVYSGWSKSRENSLVEAEKASQRALDLDPHSADALSQAGTGCLLRHDADKALEYCRKAVDLEPGNAENQALLAFAYIFVGDYEQARLHYQNVHKLCPILPNWYYLIGAQVEQNDGDLERAIAIYRQGLAVEPDAPLCRFYLVNALMQKGDTAGAQQYADEIRALDASVNGSGLVHTFSQDARLRDEFHENLAKFNLV
jgi:tetratricopeptide (TPR) repeat protein